MAKKRLLVKATHQGIEKAEKALVRLGVGTKTNFAKARHLSRTTVTKFFNREPIQLDSLQRICEELTLPWSEIIDLSENDAELELSTEEQSNSSSQSSTSDIDVLVREVRQKIQHSEIPRNLPNSGIRSLEQFFGRSHELETLYQLLQQQDQVAIVAVAGMGGVGKTELAIQYALQHLDDYPGGICWLLARGSDIGIQVVEFAKAHFQNFQNFKIPNDLTLIGQVRFCWKHWQPGEGEVLMVLDDVTDYESVRNYLPPMKSRFKVLITTRLQFGTAHSRLTLDVLSETAAVDLLRSLVGAERIERESAVAVKLCEWLGYLPLGIELVGRFLETEPDLSLEKMLSRLQKKRLKHKSLLEADPTMTNQLGVEAAIELSWERLDEKSRRLSYLLSLFALAPIPWQQVESVVKQASGLPQDEEELEDARTSLVRLHLLQRSDKETYRLHQLVREFFQGKLEQMDIATQLKQCFVGVMAVVAKQIPKSLTIERELIEFLTPMMPHVAEAAKAMTEFLSNEDLPWLFTGLGRFYENQASSQLAVFWHERRLEAIQVRFGSKHISIVPCLEDIALIYFLQGRDSEALSTYKQALEICQQWLKSNRL